MSQKLPLNHAAKCILLQLVEPIRVIHLVTEQRTGECNVIDIHPCNRLVHIAKNLKLQMPLCIPLKDNVTPLKTASAEKFQHNSAYSLQLPLLDSNESGGLIGMNVIWSHFIVR